MAEPPIADDYAFIAARLKELETTRPVQWAVWYAPGKVWGHLQPGRTTKKVGDGCKVSLFRSEEDARAAITASGDTSSTKSALTPRIYEPETPTEL